MSGATYSKFKTWAFDEELTSADLNAQFDNERNNLTPAGVDDYSATVPQMQIQTSPGAQGSESLATSTAGELERLRYVLNRLIGGTYWYDTPAISLSQANAILEQTSHIPTNRVVSGRVRTGVSAQAMALVPDGTAATVRLKAATTPLVYFVAGVQYTVSVDVPLTGLSLAPTSANTCTVNDASLTGQDTSKYAGEYDSAFPTITVDAMGANISALIGHFAAFKKGTEYFVAFVKSATELTKAYRGFFFDKDDNPITRVTLADNDVISLMKLTWVFVRADGTIVSTQAPPTYSFNQPTSPGTGDYWFDFAAMIWKTFNGSSFVNATAMLLGVCLLDSTGCKAARTGDYFSVYSDTNTIELDLVDSDTVRVRRPGSKINVAGFEYAYDFQFWSTSTDFDSGVTDAMNATYYLYVSETGKFIISDERPYDRRQDMLGRYHPYNPWRSAGQVSNDGSSNFINAVADALATIAYESAVSVGIGGLAVSTSTASYGNSSPTPSLAATVTIKTSGRPVFVGLTSDGTGTPASIESDRGNSLLTIKRNGVGVADFTLLTATATNDVYVPPGGVSFIDVAPIGTHTYELFGSFVSGLSALAIRNCKLVAYEI